MRRADRDDLGGDAPCVRHGRVDIKSRTFGPGGAPSTRGCSARWLGAPASTSASDTVLEDGIRLVEEELAMSDRIPAPGDADDQRGSEPDMSATDEFAKMRAVMRASEKHREGGVDPELEAEETDPGPDT